MKKLIVISVLLFIFLACNGDEEIIKDLDEVEQNKTENQSVLGDKIVSTEVYESALPHINDTNVNTRKYPFISENNIIFQLQKGQKVNINEKTIEIDIIDGEKWPWYGITVRDGEYKHQHGWIYGKYLTFVEGYDESFWELELFSRKRFYRSKYSEDIIIRYFSKGAYSEEKYTTDLLKDYTFLESKEATLWYVVESGFKKVQKYSTDFGELVIFINEEKNLWALIDLIIKKDLENDMVRVGMTIDDLEKIFGDDYEIDDNILRYDFDALKGDLYLLDFVLENKIIKEIWISVYYS